MVIVQIQGLKETQKFLVRLPGSVNKEILKVGGVFMRNVQKSAKLRAPRASGQLAESIRFRRKGKQLLLTVDSPYGIFQEMGFTPHWISIFQHSRAGYRFSDWLGMKGYSRDKQFFFVSRHKPFIAPALGINLSKLPNLISQGTKKAIAKAGGRR